MGKGGQQGMYVFSKWMGAFPHELGKEDRTCLRCGLSDDNRDAWLDDAGFLCGDLVQCIAQELHVVHADVGDDAELGDDDVGAVQATAQSDFDDGDVDLLFGKVVEGHRCRQFKEGRMERFEERTFLLDKTNDFFLRYRFPVDADAFPEVNQVGGGVKSGLVAGALQDGCQCVGAGTFAIGPGDMNGAELPVRMSEMLV